MYCNLRFTAKSTSSFEPFIESDISRIILPGFIHSVSAMAQGGFRLSIMSLCCNRSVAFPAIMMTLHGVAKGVFNFTSSKMEQVMVFCFWGCKENLVLE